MNILVIGMCGNSLFYQKETNELLKEEPGGKGYNQAVGIKRLGGCVSFLGAIGNDLSGESCSSYLDLNGINNLLVKKDETTTYATIYVDHDGNNEINVFLGAKLYFSYLPYIKDQIDCHDLIMLQNEIDEKLNIEIIKYARALNKILLVNPAPIATWMKDYLSYFDFITPNEVEARALFMIPESISSLEIGEFLLSKHVNNVLVTLGSKGSILIKDGKKEFFPSYKVDAIDTTGAGDLMNACIAFGLQKGYSIEESIKLGTKACAYSVTKRYVLDSYPTLEELSKIG